MVCCWVPGYVYRAVRKKILAKKGNLELLLSLEELLTDEFDIDKEDTKNWTLLSNRGGLYFVSESFSSVEQVISNSFA